MAFLVVIEKKITDTLDKCESVIGVFLDFSKAFDTVGHGIFLDKLHKYGVHGTALKWLEDYLTNRMQYVAYNFIKSEQKNYWMWCTTRIYPWSISLPIVHKWSVYCVSLVFQSCLHMFITGKDIEDMCHKLNEDLTKIQEWLCYNKLSLNVSKTHYMVFTPRNTFCNDVNVMIHNEKNERVYVTTFLRVHINAQLNWKGHIEYACKRLSKCIDVLAKARKVLYKSCLINLFCTFAYHCFIYCNHVWRNTYQTNLEKL